MGRTIALVGLLIFGIAGAVYISFDSLLDSGKCLETLFYFQVFETKNYQN